MRVERYLSQSKTAIPTFTLTSMLVTRTTTTTTTTTASTPPAMPNPPALVVTAVPAKYCVVYRKQPSSFSVKAPQSHSAPEWSQENWDRDRQREHKKRKNNRRIRQKDAEDYYLQTLFMIPHIKKIPQAQ